MILSGMAVPIVNIVVIVDVAAVVKKTVERVESIILRTGDWVTKNPKVEDYGYLKGYIWEVEAVSGKFVDLKRNEEKLHHIPMTMLQKLYIT